MLKERPRARLPGALPVVYEYSKKGWWELRKKVEPRLKWTDFEREWERIARQRIEVDALRVTDDAPVKSR